VRRCLVHASRDCSLHDEPIHVPLSFGQFVEGLVKVDPKKLPARKKVSPKKATPKLVTKKGEGKK